MDECTANGSKHSAHLGLPQNRLITVMGFVNGSEIDEIGREFWLSFGLGLGGACFRKADAQVYKRPLKAATREEDQLFSLARISYPRMLAHVSH